MQITTVFLLLPSWLNPHQYSAHRLILLSMECRAKERYATSPSSLCFHLSPSVGAQPGVTAWLPPPPPPPPLSPSSPSIPIFLSSFSNRRDGSQGVGNRMRNLNTGLFCLIMFACRRDKIDEMLCLASDLSVDSQMVVERRPCQNPRPRFSHTLYFLPPHSLPSSLFSGETYGAYIWKRSADTHRTRRLRMAAGSLHNHLDMWVFGVCMYRS